MQLGDRLHELLEFVKKIFSDKVSAYFFYKKLSRTFHS